MKEKDEDGREDEDIEPLIRQRVLKRILSEDGQQSVKKEEDFFGKMERVIYMKMMLGMADGGGGAKRQEDPMMDYTMKIMMMKGMGGDNQLVSTLVNGLLQQRTKEVGTDAAKSDPVVEMLKDQIKDQRDEMKGITTNLQSMREESREKTIENMRDNMEALQQQLDDVSHREVPQQKNLNDELISEMSKMIVEKNKKDFSRMLGVDLNKPSDQKTPSDVDKINMVVQTMSDAVSKGIEAYGRAKGMMPGQSPTQQPFTPAQPQSPMVPQPAQAQPPQIQQMLPEQPPVQQESDISYIDDQGNPLSTEETERLLKEGKLKVLGVSNEPEQEESAPAQADGTDTGQSA